MKKIIFAIILLFIAVNLYANQLTVNHNLEIPSEGSRDWIAIISKDIISIDTMITTASADNTYWHKVSADIGLTGNKSGSFDFTTSGAVTLTGTLDLTGLTADVSLFDDLLIADSASGKSLYIRRHANEGDNNIRIYVDSDANAAIEVNTNLYLQGASTGDGVGIYGSNFELFHYENVNRTFKQYGYITAAGAEKYIQWKVDDADDYFHLSRQDANILGFKINMPTTIISDVSVDTVRLATRSVSPDVTTTPGPCLYLHNDGTLRFYTGTTWKTVNLN